MSAHKNPYRKGSAYNATYETLRAAGQKGITKAALLEKHKPADVGVVLSPRAESKRGDCRGNGSAQGHKYFVALPTRQTKAGVKEKQRFVLRQRAKALEPKKRNEKVAIASQKTKVTAKVKAPAKSKTKAPVATADAPAEA